MVRGRNSIKLGYEFIAIRTEVLDINPLYGADTYNNQYSKPTCAQLSLAAGCSIPADPTSYDLADFYFGLPSTIQQGSNLTTNLRQHVHSLYVQDDWRVTPKLTLNLGLRWEFATPIWERDNLWSNFDPEQTLWCAQQTAACSTEPWCILTIKTSVRAWDWPTA
jgi:hypothetical protein